MKLKNFYTILTIDIMTDMKLVALQDMLLSNLKSNKQLAINLIAKRIVSVSKATLDSLTKEEAKAFVWFLKKHHRDNCRTNLLKVREECKKAETYKETAYAEAAFEFMTCEYCVRYLQKKLNNKKSSFATESTQNLEINSKRDILGL